MLFNYRLSVDKGIDKGIDKDIVPQRNESLQRKSRWTTHAAAPTIWFRSRSTDCRGSLFLWKKDHNFSEPGFCDQMLFLHYLRVRTLALSRVDRSLSRTKNTGVDDRLKALPRWNAECKLVVLRRSSPFGFFCLCNIVCCMVCRYGRGFFQNICER